MKKSLLLFIIANLICSLMYAQFTKKQIIKKQVEPTKTTPTQTTPVTPIYTLVAVKANIRTGSDNKEFPSLVRTYLQSRAGTAGAIFKQENLKNEMKVNSNTEFGLEKSGSGNMTLADLQSQGLLFEIQYYANFQLDAWKIEGVSITLEFRDQNGNLHPTMGQKTITFGNASGFLNGYFETRMVCTTDGYLNPLSAQIISRTN